MAIGTGSGLAHAAIDRVFSSKHPEPAEAAQAAQQIAASPQVSAPCPGWGFLWAQHSLQKSKCPKP